MLGSRRRKPVLALFALTLLALAALAALPGAAAEADREAAVRTHVRALEGLAAVSVADGVTALTSKHLAPEYRATLSDEALTELVTRIRRAAANAGMVTVAEDADGIRLTLRSGSTTTEVVFAVEESAPYRIQALRLEGGDGGAGGAEPAELESAAAPDVTWEGLEAWLADAEAKGFAGTVLAVKGGELVLHRGYGMANRKDGVRATTETVYDIGSMPIDFTRAGILFLAQQGKLALSDPITEYFDGVPPDKRGMTLEHLMTMQSGLPDFFHVEGVDEDYDLSYIDRDTAVRRILGQTLLFPPGEGREHSHAAWGLLAAVIEVVSGQSYEVFLSRNFLGPAGMTRTGPYGDDLGLPEQEFAVGYGAVASDPNIPPNWGKTSWLVKGSGGMVSTPGDMYRWYQALRAGKIPLGAQLARHIGPGVSVGGTERGFFFLRPDDGKGTVVFVASNVGGRSPLVQSVTQGLIRLVMGEVEMRMG